MDDVTPDLPASMLRADDFDYCYHDGGGPKRSPHGYETLAAEFDKRAGEYGEIATVAGAGGSPAMEHLHGQADAAAETYRAAAATVREWAAMVAERPKEVKVPKVAPPVPPPPYEPRTVFDRQPEGEG